MGNVERGGGEREREKKKEEERRTISQSMQIATQVFEDSIYIKIP